MTAALTIFGIFSPITIQNGITRTSMSVKSVSDEMVMWNELSTHVADALTTGSQFAEMGRHCRTATRNTLMAWRPLNVLRA